jgi:hypothetical protein
MIRPRIISGQSGREIPIRPEQASFRKKARTGDAPALMKRFGRFGSDCLNTTEYTAVSKQAKQAVPGRAPASG